MNPIRTAWFLILIISPLFANASAEFSHFKLNYNSKNDLLTAFACGNTTCSALYMDKKTKLHLTEDNGNHGLFVRFGEMESGQQSVSGMIAQGQCVDLKLQTKKGSSTKPESSTLKCFKDGKALSDCKLCSDGESNVNKTLSAYVGGQVNIDYLPAGNYTIKSLSGEGTLKEKTFSTKLEQGKTVSAPLNVTYNKAEKVELVLREVVNDGNGENKGNKGSKGNNGNNGNNGSALAPAEYRVTLVFVPKELSWKKEAVCDDGSMFNYGLHAKSCSVLGVAGSTVSLTLTAYGENKAIIESYTSELGVEVNELNDSLKVENTIAYDTLMFKQENSNGFEVKPKVGAVALIEALVQQHCAIYAYDSDGNCLLQTQGDSAIVGRTVPYSLKIIKTEAGDIEDDVVYAGKKGVNFDTVPSFTVVGQGQDVNGKYLPSYSGEFAGGLKNYAELVLDTEYPVHGLEKAISENKTAENRGTGEHIITLNAGNLEFTKDQPFPETPLDFPLALTIGDHDGLNLKSIEGKTTTLGNANDRLRYGFVLVQDAEVKVGEAGSMSAGLNYFGSNLQTWVEDKATPYSLKDVGSVHNAPALEPELLLDLDATRVIVQPYSKEQKNIRVTIKNLPNWLKPERDGSLADPEARLDILTQPRRRDNDSVFNRREVVR